AKTADPSVSGPVELKPHQAVTKRPSGKVATAGPIAVGEPTSSSAPDFTPSVSRSCPSTDVPPEKPFCQTAKKRPSESSVRAGPAATEFVVVLTTNSLPHLVAPGIVISSTEAPSQCAVVMTSRQ